MAGPRTNINKKNLLEEQFVSGTIGTVATIYDLGWEFEHVQIINDGSDSIYVSGNGDLPDATYAEVKPGEDIKYDPPKAVMVKGRRYIGMLAKSSTQAFRVFAWQ